MKLSIEQISIPSITRQQANEIRNAFLSANNNGSLWVHTEMKKKYPAAWELFQILSANFEDSITGIHNVNSL